MKFHEAIDMIMDGGTAYRKERDYFKYKFRDQSLEEVDEDGFDHNLSFYREDFSATDWIVEKDGVVYEEFPQPKVSAFIKHIENRLEGIADKWVADLNNRISNASTLFIADRIHEKMFPMQPIYVDSQNVARFRKNEIVRYLLDNGGIDMNEIACLDFTQEDRTQFAQLIGYSIGGYEELSYVSDKDANEASVKADKIWAHAQKDRAHEQDERGEPEEVGEPLRGGKPVELTPASCSIDEDWLEKKMLCFLRRVGVNARRDLSIIGNYKEVLGTCCNASCPFCFPPEKQETDHTPDASKMVEKGRKCNECGVIIPDGWPRCALESVPDYYYCIKCWNEMADEEIKKNDHSEDVREKVTVEGLMDMISEHSHFHNMESVRNSYDKIKRKVKYLVSLQEKD